MYVKMLVEVFCAGIVHFKKNHQKHKTSCLFIIFFSPSTHSVGDVEEEGSVIPPEVSQVHLAVALEFTRLNFHLISNDDTSL